MKVKFYLITMMMVFCAINLNAQGRFNPEKFKADLEKYITAEAGLTSAEAAKFYPLFHEMHEKQRSYYNKIREIKRSRPVGDSQCKKAISDMDKCDLQIKRLQIDYHNRMLKIISAQKLYNVITAEENFHRQAMRRAAKR